MVTPDLELVGPVGLRTYSLTRTCQTHHGHAHNYDHTTICCSGRIAVNGHELGPGESVAVGKHTVHTVKALEPSIYVCVFSHRDFDGVVSECYVGNPDAYGHERSLNIERGTIRVTRTLQPSV